MNIWYRAGEVILCCKENFGKWNPSSGSRATTKGGLQIGSSIGILA